MTHRLSSRGALRSDIENAPEHDLLLVELKASAVEVVVRTAAERGTEVVFVNNALVGTGIEEAFDGVLERARRGP